MFKTYAHAAAAVIDTLEQAGEEAWAVGGCVRDSLRGVVLHDWDLCTSAPPWRVIELFGENAYPTGERHGTITIVIDGEAVEVTTFRSDGKYLDQRRPENVQFVRNVWLDLLRRDFTMNAIAWSPTRGMRDPTGGTKDIEKGIIRAVGSPLNRFEEDALRILRAVRFFSVCGFEIEPHTAAALYDCRKLIHSVAEERMTRELLTLLCGNRAAKTVEKFAYLFCEIFGWESLSPDVIARIAREPTCDPAVRVALLCTPDDLPHLRLNRKEATAFKAIHRLNGEHRPLPRKIPSARRIIRDVGLENAMRYVAFRESYGDYAYNRARELINSESYSTWKPSSFAINGKDIMSLGVTGRKVGVVIDRLGNLVIDDIVENSRPALMRAARMIVAEMR